MEKVDAHMRLRRQRENDGRDSRHPEVSTDGPVSLELKAPKDPNVHGRRQVTHSNKKEKSRDPRTRRIHSGRTRPRTPQEKMTIRESKAAYLGDGRDARGSGACGEEKTQPVKVSIQVKQSSSEKKRMSHPGENGHTRSKIRVARRRKEGEDFVGTKQNFDDMPLKRRKKGSEHHDDAIGEAFLRSVCNLVDAPSVSARVRLLPRDDMVQNKYLRHGGAADATGVKGSKMTHRSRVERRMEVPLHSNKRVVLKKRRKLDAATRTATCDEQDDNIGDDRRRKKKEKVDLSGACEVEARARGTKAADDAPGCRAGNYETASDEVTVMAGSQSCPNDSDTDMKLLDKPVSGYGYRQGFGYGASRNLSDAESISSEEESSSESSSSSSSPSSSPGAESLMSQLMEGVADSSTKIAADRALRIAKLNAAESPCHGSGSTSGGNGSSSSEEVEGATSTRQCIAGSRDGLSVCNNDAEVAAGASEVKSGLGLADAGRAPLLQTPTQDDRECKPGATPEGGKVHNMVPGLRPKAVSNAPLSNAASTTSKSKPPQPHGMRSVSEFPAAMASGPVVSSEEWPGAARTSWKLLQRLAVSPPVYDAALQLTYASQMPAKSLEADPRGTPVAVASNTISAVRGGRSIGGKEGTPRKGVIARSRTRPSFNRVGWYPLLSLDLPEGLEYDMLEYTGTERARRQSSRLAASASSSAVLSVEATSPIVDPSGNASSLPLGQSTERKAWYTAKLRTLVSRLEEVVAPPDEVVRDFWGQLDAAERARFSAEFPQCMAYTAGCYSAAASHVSSSVARKK